jgi:hypothetical protein
MSHTLALCDYFIVKPTMKVLSCHQKKWTQNAKVKVKWQRNLHTKMTEGEDKLDQK